MPERLAADKKQKIDGAHADLLAALRARAVSLTEDETHRLREKLAAYIDKTNPEQVDIPRLADEITEKIRNPRTRARSFAPDKTEKIQRTYADLVAALQQRAVSLTDDEAERLRKKLAAYIAKTNPEHVDIPTLADAIAQSIDADPQARVRWFKKVGILHTLEEHARENTRRAAELRRSIAERTDWTPVSAETSSADGRYYLAQLLNEAHLKQESAFLEHCLGAGSLDYYLPRIKRGEIEIFSVRDAKSHEPRRHHRIRRPLEIHPTGQRQKQRSLTPDSPHIKQTVELLAFLKNHSVHHDKLDPQQAHRCDARCAPSPTLSSLCERTPSSSQPVRLWRSKTRRLLTSKHWTSSPATFPSITQRRLS